MLGVGQSRASLFVDTIGQWESRVANYVDCTLPSHQTDAPTFHWGASFMKRLPRASLAPSIHHCMVHSTFNENFPVMRDERDGGLAILQDTEMNDADLMAIFSAVASSILNGFESRDREKISDGSEIVR